VPARKNVIRESITDRKTLSLKAKPILAVDSENPRMYQCSRVFALRGIDLRFSEKHY